MKPEIFMKTLNVIDADHPDHIKRMHALADVTLWSDVRGDQFVFYTAGMSDAEISEIIQRVPFPIPQVVQTRYPSTVSMTVRAAQEEGRKAHVIVMLPVRYEPTASTFTFGGLPIPAVFEPELGVVLSLADVVTICVKSHE